MAKTKITKKEEAKIRGIECYRNQTLKSYLLYANGPTYDDYLAGGCCRRLLRQAIEFNIDLDGCPLTTENYWRTHHNSDHHFHALADALTNRQLYERIKRSEEIVTRTRLTAGHDTTRSHSFLHHELKNV